MSLHRIACMMVLVGLVLSDLAPCTPADKRYTFTPCNPLTQTRNSVTYWVNTCNATGSATQLSLPRPAPCGMECPSGRYYSAETIDCARCPAGQYSFTGDSYTRFETWPTQFVTYCTPSPCEPWQVSSLATYIHSGNQSSGGERPNGDDTVSSTLAVIVTILQSAGGSVTFTYLVESEEDFDGLAVYLNGTRQLFTANKLFLSSGLQRSWATRKILLPFGTTEVKWAYEKDSDQYSPSGASSGSDRAYIRDIFFDGSKSYTSRCGTCPAGYSSAAGATACTMCPMNTFSLEGSATCTPCADGFYAGPGSSTCIKMAPCVSVVDYAPVFSKCDSVSNSRSKTYQLVNPYCQVANNTTPAPESSIMCAKCLTGYYRQGKSACQPCPPGQFSNGPGSSCAPCKEGTTAVPNLDFPDFDSVGDNVNAGGMFSTQCVGLCRGCAGACTTNSAWEPFPFLQGTPAQTVVGLSSGTGLGAHADSVLTLYSTLTNPGSVTFEYFFFRRSSPFTSPIPDDVSGSFFVDDEEEYKLPLSCFGVENMCTLTVPLPAIRKYKFTWVFSKNFVFDTTSPILLILRSLSVVGDTRGSAITCSDCLPGFTCAEQSSVMQPCPPGFIANGTGSLTCTRCRGNTYSSEYASTYCTPCPRGSYVNADNTRCVSDCKFEDGMFTYDLSRLMTSTFGPLIIEGMTFTNDADFDAKSIYRFYFSLCQPLAFNTTFTPCPAARNPFACQRMSATRSINIGNTLSYQGQGYNGLQFTFTGGDRCGGAGIPRSTSIVMDCDPDRSNVDGKLRFVNEKPACQFNFILSIRDACPACSLTSYRSSAGPCQSNGSQQLTYYRVPEAEGCYGGVPLPTGSWSACNICTPDMFDFTWSACIDEKQTKLFFLNANNSKSTCVQTINSFPSQEVRPCAVLEVASGVNPFTIIVSIILVITILVGGYMFWVSNKKSKLKEQIHDLETLELGPPQPNGASSHAPPVPH